MIKGHYLPGSVHTGVCAASGQHRTSLPANLPEGVFKFTLDGGGIRLALHSTECCAVVS